MGASLCCYAEKVLPASVVQVASLRVAQFAIDYRGEVPSRLHSRELDRGGTPGWHPGFAAWLTRLSRPAMDEVEPDRIRVTRAMRSLRKVAPREHDVCYRALVLSHSPEQIQLWLNDRAIRQGHAERYTLKDTCVLIISGVDKIAEWI